MDEVQIVDPVQVDAVKATMRHLRDAVQDEGYKPARNLDEVEREQLDRISGQEEVVAEKPAAKKAEKPAEAPAEKASA